VFYGENFIELDRGEQRPQGRGRGGYQHAAFAFEAAGVFEQARSCNLVRGRERDRPAATRRIALENDILGHRSNPSEMSAG